MSDRIRTKSIYDPVEDDDGVRVLADRLWPRGMTKREARVGLWARELAPSDELRRWFARDPGRRDEFERRYHQELDRNTEAVEELVAAVAYSPVTILYSSLDPEFGNAAALKTYLERRGLVE